MTTDKDYIEKNLIAYIGNKRRLLNLIEEAIKQTGVLKKEGETTFLDLFAGSGSVSRLAKSLGFATTSNDWEQYSYIINRAFLELDRNFLESSFAKLGGLENVLARLNSLTEPKAEDSYISKYYCPQNDERPDLENERLFYTSYNGKKIDAIRAQIEDWRAEKAINEDEENLLLALLLYEASTRSNTSGVFKAFHRGFGGSNGDALSRIMKEVTLAKPALINGKKAEVHREDAVKLSEQLTERRYDIVYLDPPYNQHQYGSNYHLLNTIALNDRPEVNKKIIINGKKLNKSAIRKDWIKTRSTFCYKSSATEDFKTIISNLQADYFLLSYSTDGIIPFNELLEMLAEKGRVNIVLSEYTKYRGGKQALTSEVKNIEFIIMVDTTEPGRVEDIVEIKKFLLFNKLSLLMKKTINPLKAERLGFRLESRVDENMSISKVLTKSYNTLHLDYHFDKNQLLKVEETLELVRPLELESLEQIHSELESITDLTKEDEIYLYIADMKRYYEENSYEEAIEMLSRIPHLLSKFNNKKAYLPALKACLAILTSIDETIAMCREYKISKKRFFHKLEKIILQKLEYRLQDKLSEVKHYKREIGALYDSLITSLEEPVAAAKSYLNQELSAPIYQSSII